MISVQYFFLKTNFNRNITKLFETMLLLFDFPCSPIPFVIEIPVDVTLISI